MLEKKYRIHQEMQYKRIFSGGKKQVGRYMVLIFMPNGLDYSRAGIITSKKVGKAHERNFARRRMRAFIREYFSSIKEGYDMVFIARAGIKAADFAAVVKDFTILLKKGRLVR